MFDNSRLGPEGRGSLASFQEVAALLPQVIGHIQTVIGSGTLARACGIAGEVKVGELRMRGQLDPGPVDGLPGELTIQDVTPDGRFLATISSDRGARLR